MYLEIILLIFGVALLLLVLFCVPILLKLCLLYTSDAADE